MMTLVAILVIWGLGSVVFALTIASSAAKTVAAQSPWAGAQIEAARAAWERLTAVKTQPVDVPVYARQIRAH